jgi:hypothetical protein
MSHAILSMKQLKGRVGTWYHLIQSERATGRARVLATICNYRSVNKLQVDLQTVNDRQNGPYVYSIDPTPVNEPNRRCDGCKCGS